MLGCMTVARRDVRIVEVGPRDGLQNIPAFIPTEEKARLIRALAEAGLSFIETTSFVSPKAVPQMADSRQVAATLPADSVVFSALVPNMRGFEAALEARLPQIGVLAASTDSYSLRNTNSTVADSLGRISEITKAAHREGMSVRAYLSCAISCPYEGPVPVASVSELAERLIALECDEVILSDTVGDGTPARVGELLAHTLESIAPQRLGVHFHDTYGQALANAARALAEGVSRFDSSVAGLGGSPSAPEAGGNLSTEDLVFMLEGEGLKTGVDLEALARIGLDFCTRFGLQHASRTGRAVGGRSMAGR